MNQIHVAVWVCIYVMFLLNRWACTVVVKDRDLFVSAVLAKQRGQGVVVADGPRQVVHEVELAFKRTLDHQGN